MHGGHRSNVHGVERHAMELQLVVQAGDIGELASEQVDRLDNHHIQSAESRLSKKRVATGTVAVAA
jgi:hypothetical protein